jgi:hypothetical protein
VEDELSVDKAAVDQRRNVEVEDQELAKQVAMKLANGTFPGAEAEEEWFAGWEVEGYSWEFDAISSNRGVITVVTRELTGAGLHQLLLYQLECYTVQPASSPPR